MYVSFQGFAWSSQYIEPVHLCKWVVYLSQVSNISFQFIFWFFHCFRKLYCSTHKAFIVILLTANYSYLIVKFIEISFFHCVHMYLYSMRLGVHIHYSTSTCHAQVAFHSSKIQLFPLQFQTCTLHQHLPPYLHPDINSYNRYRWIFLAFITAYSRTFSSQFNTTNKVAFLLMCCTVIWTVLITEHFTATWYKQLYITTKPPYPQNTDLLCHYGPVGKNGWECSVVRMIDDAKKTCSHLFTLNFLYPIPVYVFSISCG